MRSSHAAGATALLLLAIVSGASANFFGEGTYYGDNGWAGACQGNVPWDGGYKGSKSWPPSSYGLNVALNSAQYSTSQCGRRLKYRGTGKGLGGNPPPQQWQEATVTNLCPECKYGDLDFGKSGDGRWEIEWYWVDDAPASGNQVESTGSKTRAIPKSQSPKPPTKSLAQRQRERAAYLKRKALKLRAALAKKRAAAKALAKKRAARAAYLKRKAAKLAKILKQRKAERAAYLKRKAAKLAALKRQRGRRLL